MQFPYATQCMLLIFVVLAEVELEVAMLPISLVLNMCTTARFRTTARGVALQTHTGIGN